jgi:replicative DNA helicase
MSLGLMFISAALAEGSVSEFLQFGNIEELFKANEVEQYVFVRDFVKKYAKIPAEDTIKAHTGAELFPHKETAQYYFDLLSKRHVEITLKQVMKKAADMLQPDVKDADSALKLITSTIMKLMTTKHQKQISDFREAFGLIIPEYVQQYSAEMGNRLMLGWQTFDEMSGGLVRGDLISFVGRPAIGKTYQMLYSAMHGWRKANEQYLQTGELPEGSSRMFVSMEMDRLPIQQRMAAMQASIPMDHVKHAALSTVGFKKLKDGLVNVAKYGAPFWVVDGNLTATVEDIYMLARQLKPGAIFIDGGYLLKHPTEKDRYRRVAENADLAKKELASLVPTVCSWQFARPKNKGGKKADGANEKLDLDDIGYTDAIAQVSSIVIGMFEEQSIETIMRRLMALLKGRNGEVGSWITNWDFKTMDFSEHIAQAVSELQFV